MDIRQKKEGRCVAQFVSVMLIMTAKLPVYEQQKKKQLEEKAHFSTFCLPVWLIKIAKLSGYGQWTYKEKEKKKKNKIKQIYCPAFPVWLIKTAKLGSP